MATAAGKLVTGFHNSPGRIRARNHKGGGIGHAIFRFDCGAFNDTTNPEGIRGLGASDKIKVAQVSREDSATPANIPNSPGIMLINSIKSYSDATFALGTASLVTVWIERRSNSSLPNVILGTLTEAGGFIVANTMVGLSDIGLLVEEGDSIVLVPDAAIDTSAAATTDVYVEVNFKRLQDGGRLSEAAAAA